LFLESIYDLPIRKRIGVVEDLSSPFLGQVELKEAS
jgi:hypothetical protein